MDNLEHLKPPFKRSAEVDSLINAYENMEVGASIGYEEVRTIIHEDPRSSKGSGITQRARTRCLIDSNIVIVCVPSFGFQRVTEPEKIDVAKDHHQKVRRAVKRGLRVISSVDVLQLNGEQILQYSITINGFGALNQATRPAMAKRIEKAIQDHSKEINERYILALMDRK